MPFPVSTVQAFRAALLEALAAQPALDGVAVTDGPASAAQMQLRSLVMILDITGYKIQARPLNALTQPRRETYTQEVTISVVQKARTTSTAVNLSAFELFDAFNQALREDPSVDGSVISAVISDKGGHILMKTRLNDERETAIEFGIDVVAKI